MKEENGKKIEIFFHLTLLAKATFRIVVSEGFRNSGFLALVLGALGVSQ